MGNNSSVQMRAKSTKSTDKQQPIQSVISFTVYQHIAQFLSLKELLHLGACCAQFQQYEQDHQSIFYQHYYREFMTAQLEMIVEFSYPDSTIRNQIRNHTFQCTNYDWKGQLKKMRMARQQLQMPLYFCEFLFPKPILRRETMGTYCETEYQVMLAQRLELEQKGFDKLFEAHNITDNVMKYLRSHKEEIIQNITQLFQENQNSKQAFFNHRWNIQQGYNSQQNIILQLLQEITYTANVYMKGIQQHLAQYGNQQVKNAIELLNEYLMFWQAYTNTILEMQSVLIPFEEIVNEIYSKEFKEYPQYPKYSVWRTLTKEWIQQMNEHIFIIEECFIKLMKSQRQQQLNKEFDQNVEPTLHITHELYDNFIKRKHLSVMNVEIDINHQCYTDVIDLLANILKSLQDISVSEVCVHWIGHSNCKYEEIYDSFTKRILHETSLYYDQQKDIFIGNLEEYINFLILDQKFVKQFVSDQLMFQIVELQKEHLYTMIQWFMKDHLSNYINSNEETVISVFNHKLDRLSIASSQNNDHLETQPDFQDPQKLFDYVLKNPNADLDKMMLQSHLAQCPDPFQEITKVCLQDLYPEIDLIVNQEMPAPQLKFKRSFSFTKTLDSNSCIDIPEEFVQIASKYMIELQPNLYAKFQDFTHANEKDMLKWGRKNQEINLINEDREIPLELPPYLREFYDIGKQVSLESLEMNKVEPEDDEYAEIDLSKSSSKLKSFSEHIDEIYNSEDEEIQ